MCCTSCGPSWTPTPTRHHCDTLSFCFVRSKGRWGSQSLASDPGETGRKFSSTQGFFCMQHIHQKRASHGICIYVIYTVWLYDVLFFSMIPKRKVQTSKATKHTRWPRLETNHGIQHLGSFCAKNRNKTKLWAFWGRSQADANRKKKRAMNLCLLRVPGTHLFSIWAFKALKKTKYFFRSKEKSI